MTRIKNVEFVNRLKNITKGSHFTNKFSYDGLIRHYNFNIKAAIKLTEKRMATLIWD